jgi:uncharacterized phage protein gp47/JayE
MTTTGDVVAKMVTALNAAEPDLDVSVGTVARKILDAVGESIAEAFADSHLIQYQYDIDSKVGGDLDDFCALFGITRIPAQRAQGVVTFTRPNDQFAATTAMVIAPGTQVVAQTNPIVYVQTAISSVMNVGQLTVDVPVQAVVAGPGGNVAAGMLATVATAVSGIASVLNAAPMSGGSAQESDADLRVRFRATVFRSLAGTQSMYQAIALATPQDPTMPLTRAVTQVNVLGATKRYREQIQVVAGTATSTVVRAAYIFAENVYCGADIDGGSLLIQGTNFTFTPSNPTNGSDATAVLSALTGMPDGLYDLDFEYVTQASRNDPANTRFAKGGVNNRIDVWLNGTIADVATQSVVFSNARVFSNTVSDPYYRNAFAQSSAGTPNPPAGNYFIPLAFGPITSVPTTLVIAGTTYTLGSDYWITQREDAFGMSPFSLYGLSWQTTRVPPNGSAFSLTYNYNRIARDVQENINQWRLVGTDAQAHCGIRRMIKFHFAIVYDRQYDSSAVNTNIDIALSALCSSLGFAASLQVSDVIQTVHNVPGVDNVRFLTSADDAVSYAMASMSPWAANTQLSLYASGGRAVDATFGNSQYPVYHSSRIIAKAPNTFPIGA